MSDIVRQKQLTQEEHPAWKRIGKAIRNHRFEMRIRNLASLHNLEDKEYENSSDTERLGCQFLKIIDKCNEYPNEQEFVDKFLIFLHKVALDVL
jgi:hypothetical protein